jgi:hypothetical protein
VAPLAPGRYALQFTVGQGTYEKLRYAQALLGHALPTGELPAVFDRAVDGRARLRGTCRPRSGARSGRATGAGARS